jgi:hypothetical protein
VIFTLLLISSCFAEAGGGGIPLNPDAKANKGKDMSHIYVMSCANHVIQHRGALTQYLDMGYKSYPIIEDTREALKEIAKRMAKVNGKTLSKDRVSWFSSYLSACPESFWKDKSIGYIWVGAGIPTKLVDKAGPLLLFCPASSHQGSSEHSHTCGTSNFCVYSNESMILALKNEIKRSASGEIPYTKAAVEKMRQQIALREKHQLQKRKR